MAGDPRTVVKLGTKGSPNVEGRGPSWKAYPLTSKAPTCWDKIQSTVLNASKSYSKYFRDFPIIY